MSIFKACDIRGVYPDEIDERAAEAIGRAVGTELDRAGCVLAGDVRLSTPPLKSAVQRGLLGAGADVVDLGIVPTPVAYWARRRMGIRGAVIVTASHNPPEHNGVKFMLGPLAVTPEDIERVRVRAEQGDFHSGRGRLSSRDVRDEYLAWLAERFEGTGAGMKALVDAGSGTASLWAPPAFRAAGYQVEELFCEPDGRFPNRSPNPSAEALGAASARVRAVGADFAACFDGDGDRVAFLDERGRAVSAEDALILLARDALGTAPGAAVIYDQKCTRMVPREIERAGGQPLMERSGHSFIKRRLVEEGALLAGEASGHFFFGELGGDDGTYAALRMGELIARGGRHLGALLGTIPPYFISEDVRVTRPAGDSERLVQHLRDAFANLPQDHTDGVRIEFEGGWALCRASVTEPAMTVRVEGDTPERMAEIRDLVLRAIPRARDGKATAE